MEVLPIDLTAIVAIIMGISIVLVPVIGLTARFVLKPFQESLGRFLQARGEDETVRILERRMALLEHQMETMETTLGRLAEVAEFHHELRAGAPPHPPTPSGRGDTAVPPAPPGNARP